MNQHMTPEAKAIYNDLMEASSTPKEDNVTKLPTERTYKRAPAQILRDTMAKLKLNKVELATALRVPVTTFHGWLAKGNMPAPLALSCEALVGRTGQRLGNPRRLFIVSVRSDKAAAFATVAKALEVEIKDLEV
ncbi:MAG: hypothetical protein ACE5HV_00065 [Acidobacteriota bacterium]